MSVCPCLLDRCINILFSARRLTLKELPIDEIIRIPTPSGASIPVKVQQKTAIHIKMAVNITIQFFNST